MNEAVVREADSSDQLSFGIVVPVGPGGEARLRYTLRSLAAQKVVVKVALCDASGSEAVRKLADEFAEMIVYRRHGPDDGQSDAINEGWRNLDTDILGWLNADDYLTSDALAVVSAGFAQYPEADLVYGQSQIIDPSDRIIGLHPAVCSAIDLLPRHNIISQPSCFVRSDALRQVGHVGANLHYVMDWELWIRLWKAGKKFCYLPEVLSTVLWEQGTKTATFAGRRFQEIASLAFANNNPVAACKTVIGFALHHVTEYTSIGAAINDWMRRHIRSLEPAGRSWRADRAAHSEIVIYRNIDSPQLQLRLSFTKPVTVEATINGERFAGQSVKELSCAIKATGDDRAVINLDEPALQYLQSISFRPDWPV